MDRDRGEREWPLVCVLACLLVLVVTWPQGWERAASVRSSLEAECVEAQSFSSRPAIGPSVVGLDAEAGEVVHLAPSVVLPAAPKPRDPAPLSFQISDPQNGVGRFQLAEAAPKLAALIEVDWAELPLGDLTLPTRSRAAEADEDRPSACPWATDILPHLDRIVAQSAGLPRTPPWTGPWPEPIALWEKLEAVAWECETGPWARQVTREVHKLGAATGAPRGEARSVIGRLDVLSGEGERLATGLSDVELAAKVRQAQDALSRRVALWGQVLAAGGPSTPVHDPADVDPGKLAACLARIDKLEGDPAAVRAWRAYLDLDAIERLITAPEAADWQARSAAARRTLARFARTGLTAPQRELLAGEPFADLRRELQRWAAEPLDLGGLLRHVEQYEQTGAAGDARRVAEDCLLLELSPDANLRELAGRLRVRYQGANVRFAITRKLMERMLPDRKPELQWVNDRVLGRPVHGRSVTSADLGIRMIPDPKRLRIALEVEGLVSSLTEASAGPATFRNSSQAKYVASKEIEIGTWGLRFHPAEVRVDNNTWLRSVRTSLDMVPILGALAQEIAQSQHEKSQPEANREVEQKVAARAKAEIDQESDAHLGELNQRLKDRVIEPMAALRLGPAMVRAETTRRRLDMQLRLAGDDQLGGHTPRPWAPGDSLASCQVHESALNNAIQRIGLDGRTLTLTEIRERIADAFNAPGMFEDEPERDDVEITFADRDALSVRCQDGRLAVSLSIARLENSSSTWTDFQVRAYYRPQMGDLGAELVRDGIVELATGHSLRSQIPLRGVFSKTFSKNRPWRLIPEQWAGDPRMAGLAVTQLVIEDGWIGIAIGPKRPESERLMAQRDAGSVD